MRACRAGAGVETGGGHFHEGDSIQYPCGVLITSPKAYFLRGLALAPEVREVTIGEAEVASDSVRYERVEVLS